MAKKEFLDNAKEGLLQLLEKVQDKNLTKEELESVKTEMSIYDMMIDVEKVENDNMKNKMDFIKLVSGCENPNVAKDVAVQLGVINTVAIEQ